MIVTEADLDAAIAACSGNAGWSSRRCLLAQAATRTNGKEVNCCAATSTSFTDDSYINHPDGEILQAQFDRAYRRYTTPEDRQQILDNLRTQLPKEV